MASNLPEKEETNIGAHALLITDEGKIVLQQREDKPYIVNPGKITMFGGTLRARENLKAGLGRELLDELEIDIGQFPVKKLGVYYKTKELDGIDYVIHVYLVFDVKLSSLKLHEGAGFLVGKASNLLGNRNLTRITRLALENFLKLKPTTRRIMGFIKTKKHYSDKELERKTEGGGESY